MYAREGKSVDAGGQKCMVDDNTSILVIYIYEHEPLCV